MHMISQEELETLIKFSAPLHIVDVRKKPAVEKDPAMIREAIWQDFQAVPSWSAKVNTGAPVVCYCVHGHAVSQSATAALREAGVTAYYLQGGFEAWQARSGPLAL